MPSIPVAKEKIRPLSTQFLGAIKRGTLRVENPRKKRNSKDLNASYYSDGNALVIYRDSDITDLKANRTLIHELYHYYQDLQKLVISRLDIEYQAHLKSGEYVIAVKNYSSATNKSAVAQYIKDKHGPILRGRPGPAGSAIWLAYYQRIKDQKRIQEWEQNLKDAVVSAYYFAVVLVKMLPHLVQNVTKDISRARGSVATLKTQLLPQLEANAQTAKTRYEDWIANGDRSNRKAFELETDIRMQTHLSWMAYQVVLKQMIAALEGRGGCETADQLTKS